VHSQAADWNCHAYVPDVVAPSALHLGRMSDTALDTPQSLREKAEKCFRLAGNLPQGGDADTLERYGRELLEQAEQVEAASKTEG
jgi:hypothetical protein